MISIGVPGEAEMMVRIGGREEEKGTTRWIGEEEIPVPKKHGDGAPRLETRKHTAVMCIVVVHALLRLITLV